MEKWICVNCDTENNAENEFCRECGMAKEGFGEENPKEEAITTTSRVECCDLFSEEHLRRGELYLVAMSNFIRIAGIVLCIISLGCAIILLETIDKGTAISLTVAGVLVLIATLPAAYLLRVLANMSNVLRKIEKKIGK